MIIESMNTEVKHIESVPGRAKRARALAALGDPTRLGVMELLSVQDLSPDVLAAALEVSGNLLAHHLKVLEAEGLIVRTHSQSDRRRIYVQAVDGVLDALLPQATVFEVPRVVFVCTHNSARSVLAEAIWRESSDVPSASAGTHPAEQINPQAQEVARRSGLTLDGAIPRSLDTVVQPDDLVVSVCDSVNEELSPFTQAHVHWSIPDPAAIGTDDAFTDAVEELRDRISLLAPRVHRLRTSSELKALA